jgi:hypothetical protein
LFCLNRRVWLAIQIYVCLFICKSSPMIHCGNRGFLGVTWQMFEKWKTNGGIIGSKAKSCCNGAVAVGRQSAIHTENSWFASPTLGQHISTFRGYRILFSIRNPYINHVNCSALTGVYDWQCKYVFVCLYANHLPWYIAVIVVFS